MTKLEAYRVALTEACRFGDVPVVKALTKAIFSETDDADCIMVSPLILQEKVSDTRTNSEREATR